MPGRGRGVTVVRNEPAMQRPRTQLGPALSHRLTGGPIEIEHAVHNPAKLTMPLVTPCAGAGQPCRYP
jgi:hypothetical protein